jgi:hypothetical protein
MLTLPAKIFPKRACGAFEKGKGKKNQGTTSRTQRKPMLSFQ